LIKCNTRIKILVERKIMEYNINAPKTNKQKKRTKYANNTVPELTTICLFFLKISNVWMDFRLSGREFHNFAPFTETAV